MSVLLISLLSSLVWRVDNVDITALWIPDTFQEGTKSSMVIDCVYNYTLADRDSLEVKWYFKQGLDPVYQWIPPNPPQVISPLFQKHVVPNFEVTSDPFMKFRALNLGNVTTDLAGLYSCRVSSNNGDSFKSKQLTIFCEVYPQPTTQLVIKSITGEIRDLTEQSSSSTLWINGKFNQRTDTILSLSGAEAGNDGPVLGETDTVQCQVGLPGTKYTALLYRNIVLTNQEAAAIGQAARRGYTVIIPTLLLHCLVIFSYFI